MVNNVNRPMFAPMSKTQGRAGRTNRGPAGGRATAAGIGPSKLSCQRLPEMPWKPPEPVGSTPYRWYWLFSASRWVRTSRMSRTGVGAAAPLATGMIEQVSGDLSDRCSANARSTQPGDACWPLVGPLPLDPGQSVGVADGPLHDTPTGGHGEELRSQRMLAPVVDQDHEAATLVVERIRHRAPPRRGRQPSTVTRSACSTRSAPTATENTLS